MLTRPLKKNVCTNRSTNLPYRQIFLFQSGSINVMVSSFISQWPWKSDCLLKYGNMCIVLLYSLLSDNSQLSPGRFPFLNCKNVILIDTFNAVGLHFERNPKKRFSGVCRLSWSVGKSNVQFYCLALLLKRGCLKTRINNDLYVLKLIFCVSVNGVPMFSTEAAERKW